MKRWLYKQIGILKKINEAELEIIENIQQTIPKQYNDDIVEIVMNALRKIRR